MRHAVYFCILAFAITSIGWSVFILKTLLTMRISVCALQGNVGAIQKDINEYGKHRAATENESKRP